MKNHCVIFQNLKLLLILYILITIAISVQLLLADDYMISGHMYSHYNNFIVFKQSFIHLFTQNNLYEIDSNHYSHADYQFWDFKYSPTFAVYMIFFAYIPTWLGLILWNLLNTVVIFLSVKNLPIISNRIKVAILWFILIEFITTIQNAQSNALIAGLLIFAYTFMEKKKISLAMLCIALSVFIKPFGILGLSLFFLYPEKIKSALYFFMWFIILLALPLIFVSAGQLIYLYKSWFNLLNYDHEISYGLSVMGWLYTWFGLSFPKNIILLTGTVIFILPLLKVKMFRNEGFRLLMICSILIWVIIFNHKAESNTFIIADCGIALWYFSKPRKIIDTILVIAAFVFTILSPSDLFPRYLRVHFVIPYVLKVVPCIFIWIKINIEMMTFNARDGLKEFSPQVDH